MHVVGTYCKIRGIERRNFDEEIFFISIACIRYPGVCDTCLLIKQLSDPIWPNRVSACEGNEIV